MRMNGLYPGPATAPGWKFASGNPFGPGCAIRVGLKSGAPWKSTTAGPCILCGSGSCKEWRFAALTVDKHVDQDALLKAHKVTPVEVHHDEDGKPTEGGAVPLVPVADKPSKSFTKHGGRVAPLPQRKVAR